MIHKPREFKKKIKKERIFRKRKRKTYKRGK